MKYLKKSSPKVAYLGILGTLAIVLTFLENLLLPQMPFMPPGVKVGLSNVVTLFTACTFGVPGTFFIIGLKSLFVLLTRGGSAFFMSLSGGVLSGSVMLILLRFNLKQVSYIGISIIAAVFHNLGQLLVSMFFTQTPALIYYYPVLMISGVLSGVLTGLLLCVLLPLIQKTFQISKIGGKDE